MRSQDRGSRVRAALVWSEMADPADAGVATALVKAVKEGDFAVREGIAAAMEKSIRSGRRVSVELAAMAAVQGMDGAYARAAQRAVK